MLTRESSGQIHSHIDRGRWYRTRNFTVCQGYILCCQCTSHSAYSYDSLTESVKVPIKWESVDVTPQIVDGKTVIPDAAIQSVHRNYVALKGPLAVRQPTFKVAVHLTIIDSRRKRSRLTQSDTSSNIQSICQPSSLQVDCWLQDTIRQCRHDPHPRKHRRRIFWH